MVRYIEKHSTDRSGNSLLGMPRQISQMIYPYDDDDDALFYNLIIFSLKPDSFIISIFITSF